MGILFVVFALVIVIVSGIPMAKKKLEENKNLKSIQKILNWEKMKLLVRLRTKEL